MGLGLSCSRRLGAQFLGKQDGRVLRASIEALFLAAGSERSVFLCVDGIAFLAAIPSAKVSRSTGNITGIAEAHGD